jgi:hypothetical protein
MAKKSATIAPTYVWSGEERDSIIAATVLFIGGEESSSDDGLRGWWLKKLAEGLQNALWPEER